MVCGVVTLIVLRTLRMSLFFFVVVMLILNTRRMRPSDTHARIPLDLDLVEFLSFFCTLCICCIFNWLTDYIANTLHMHGRDANLSLSLINTRVECGQIVFRFSFFLLATLDYYVECVLLISLLSTRSAWFNSIKFQFNTFTFCKYISGLRVCVCVFVSGYVSALAFTLEHVHLLYKHK